MSSFVVDAVCSFGFVLDVIEVVVSAPTACQSNAGIRRGAQEQPTASSYAAGSFSQLGRRAIASVGPTLLRR